MCSVLPAFTRSQRLLWRCQITWCRILMCSLVTWSLASHLEEMNLPHLLSLVQRLTGTENWGIFHFSLPEHKVLRLSFCDSLLSIVRASVHQCVSFFIQTTSALKPLMGFWQNSTGMIPAWSPTKIVQMVLIDCICRSRGQKIGFQNAIFKHLLVWNYKA